MLQENEVRDIVKQYGSPCYIFDEGALKQRVAVMRKIVGGKYQLCYSIKANPFLIPMMKEIVDALEVCSPGELEICKACNVNPTMIIYSGVNKTPVDIKAAMEYGVGTFTAESKKHVVEINEEARRENKVVPVLLRLNAGSQFGMSKDDFLDVITNRNLYSHLEIVGIHYFAGTQRKKTTKQEKELQLLLDLIQELKEDYHFDVQRLEYGPGLSVSMFEKDDYSDTLAPLKNIHDELVKVSNTVSLQIEMGRFYATYCGSYISTVMDVKENEGVNYCIIDGGINHINYYGSMMGMNQPIIDHHQNGVDQEEKHWCICGSLCSTNDIEVRDYVGKGVEIGDYFVFHNIGAYSITEGIYLFLSRTMPKVLLRKENGTIEVARDCEESYILNTPRKNVL